MVPVRTTNDEARTCILIAHAKDRCSNNALFYLENIYKSDCIAGKNSIK